MLSSSTFALSRRHNEADGLAGRCQSGRCRRLVPQLPSPSWGRQGIRNVRTTVCWRKAKRTPRFDLQPLYTPSAPRHHLGQVLWAFSSVACGAAWHHARHHISASGEMPAASCKSGCWVLMAKDAWTMSLQLQLQVSSPEESTGTEAHKPRSPSNARWMEPCGPFVWPVFDNSSPMVPNPCRHFKAIKDATHNLENFCHARKTAGGPAMRMCSFSGGPRLVDSKTLCAEILPSIDWGCRCGAAQTNRSDSATRVTCGTAGEAIDSLTRVQARPSRPTTN